MLDDVELFLELNEEYRPKPVIASPTRYDPDSLLSIGRRRAASMNDRHSLRGQRVLEIGCGFGETARVLAGDYGCRVVAVDLEPHLPEKWAEFGDCGVDFRLFDATAEDTSSLGEFDFIYSNGVFEHVFHPFAMMTALAKLIPPGGRIHLNMGLHRGTMGSHLYRDVLFPWPHLVFTEGTFERFYERIGKPRRRPVWINHLTCSQYLEMFDVAGLHVDWVNYSVRPLDQPFYKRFEDILSRYPIYDLERDLMYVDLVKPAAQQLLDLVDPPHPGGKTLKQLRFECMRDELARLERAAAKPTAEAPQNSELERLNGHGVSLGEIRAVACELEAKVTRLQTIEERLNRDLQGVRRVARAVGWTSTRLRALTQPPVELVRSALSAASARLPAAPAKETQKH